MFSETKEIAREVIRTFMNILIGILFLVLADAMILGTLQIPMFGIATTFFGYVFLIIGFLTIVIAIIDLILSIYIILK